MELLIWWSVNLKYSWIMFHMNFTWKVHMYVLLFYVLSSAPQNLICWVCKISTIILVNDIFILFFTEWNFLVTQSWNAYTVCYMCQFMKCSFVHYSSDAYAFSYFRREESWTHVAETHIILYMHVVQWQSNHVKDVSLVNTLNLEWNVLFL